MLPTTFEYIRRLIYDRSAIALEPDKEYLIDSRLGPLAVSEGLPSIDALADRLRSTPFGALHTRVVEAMTTNETSFFRDVHPFQALQKHILPDLLQARAPNRSLAIWCAACSSGQEPYSLAMLIHEHFQQLLNWRVQVVATDLSTGMLARSKAGVYSQLEVNRGLPAPLLVKYFTRIGNNWQVRDDLRKMIDFRQLNLAETWTGIPSVDLILMRNVLIYFDLETRKGILNKVGRTLRTDGYLLLGGAETTLGVDVSFDRQQLEKATCYRLRVGAGVR